MTAYGKSSNDGVVFLRSAGNTRKDGLRSTGQFSLPAYMVREIPQGAMFRAEWHPDGILYRFMGTNRELLFNASAPDWVTAARLTGERP